MVDQRMGRVHEVTRLKHQKNGPMDYIALQSRDPEHINKHIIGWSIVDRASHQAMMSCFMYMNLKFSRYPSQGSSTFS